MALYHRASIVPSKPEVLAEWVPTQPWCAADEITPIGAFRFDDPLHQVGLETHVVDADGQALMVPLTYRSEPVEAGEAALVRTIEHSALGTRWVYDGFGDTTYLTMLAAVSLTGQGEALGMVEVDGRWIMAPANVRISGGGWPNERIPVDGLAETRRSDDGTTTFANERFELTAHRALHTGPAPAVGLTATWDGLGGAVVMTEVRALAD